MTDDPTWLGLGVQRAGTTLLHTWLAEHPEVCVPTDRKEVDYFSRYHHRGREWYRALFRPQPHHKAMGEFSISYLGSPEAMDRIAGELPRIRVIVSLRDPVVRFDSQYRHYVVYSGYRGSRRDFLREHPNAFETGCYAPQIARVLGLLPRDQIHVVIFEEVVADSTSAARALYDFVRVDADFRPPSLDEHVNPVRPPKRPEMLRMVKGVSRFATRHDLRWLLRLGRNTPVASLLSGTDAAQGPVPIEPGLAAELRDQYAADISATGHLLGRDLAGVWSSNRNGRATASEPEAEDGAGCN